jgi:protein-S-isoprenylcysteine O-methyltransferase Ste14
MSILIMVALHFLFPVFKIILLPWNFLGILPLLFGLLVNFIVDRAFKKHRTTVKPFEKSTALITSGVFRFSRNPMYLGFVLILMGIATLMGSLTPYIVVLGFAILMDIIFIRAEEQMLQSTFGEDWMEYKKKVRRWI